MIIALHSFAVGGARAERWVRLGEGKSMLPTLPVQCWIETLISDDGYDLAQVGEVIHYRGREGKWTIHRITIKHKDGSFTVQGDGNPLPDPFRVTRSRFIGRCPRFGTTEEPFDLKPIPSFDTSTSTKDNLQCPKQKRSSATPQ